MPKTIEITAYKFDELEIIMPKTIEITAYKFDELPDTAKDRARSYYIEHWMTDDWYQCTIDYMKEEGEHKHGFDIKEIRFSGFCSQGDGASWCGAVRLSEWIASKPTTYQEQPTTQIILALINEGWIDEQIMVSFGTHHYCHEYTMDVGGINHYYNIEEDVEMAEGMFKGAQVGELINIVDAPHGALYDMSKELEEDCKDFARTIYRELEDDYESSIEDENIAANYNANEVLFDEAGRVV